MKKIFKLILAIVFLMGLVTAKSECVHSKQEMVYISGADDLVPLNHSEHEITKYFWIRCKECGDFLDQREIIETAAHDAVFVEWEGQLYTSCQICGFMAKSSVNEDQNDQHALINVDHPFTSTPLPTLLSGKESYGDFEYQRYSNGDALLVGYKGSATELLIPARLAGYPVIAIGQYAFVTNRNLTTVTIPEGVREIGEMAFYDCSALKSVSLPESLEKIEKNAFCECKSLRSISIPNGVKQIDDAVFFGCNNLSDIQIQANHPRFRVENGLLIDKQDKKLLAYEQGDQKTEIFIPGSIEHIGDRLFYGDDLLKYVHIPSNVDNIGLNTLNECKSVSIIAAPNSYAWEYAKANGIAVYERKPLETGETRRAGDYSFKLYQNQNVIITKYSGSESAVTVPAALEGYKVAAIGDNAFSNRDTIVTLQLPSDIVSIGEKAFYDCDKLTTLNIPGKVNRIGQRAFASCEALKTITISSNHPYYKVQDGMLIEKKSNTLISYTNGATRKSISIPAGVVKIGNYAFFGCDNLTSVTIPNSVTSIGNYAFYGCSALTFTASRNSAAWQYAVSNNIRINELKTPTPRPVITKAPTATPYVFAFNNYLPSPKNIKARSYNDVRDVYSGPGTNYYRGAKGKAAVDLIDTVSVWGVENGWYMISYSLNSGGERIGYIRKSGVALNDYALKFSYQNAYLTKNVNLTDDPDHNQASICVIYAGSKVKYLATYEGDNKAWYYVE